MRVKVLAWRTETSLSSVSTSSFTGVQFPLPARLVATVAVSDNLRTLILHELHSHPSKLNARQLTQHNKHCPELRQGSIKAKLSMSDGVGRIENALEESHLSLIVMRIMGEGNERNASCGRNRNVGPLRQPVSIRLRHSSSVKAVEMWRWVHGCAKLS